MDSLERDSGPDFLPDRLNAEPPVFKGCSVGELSTMAGIAAVIWIPACLVIAALFGGIAMGFGIAGLGIVATTVVAATYFRRVKTNQPDGYYLLAVKCWLEDHKLLRSGLVRQSITWEIGRS